MFRVRFIIAVLVASPWAFAAGWGDYNEKPYDIKPGFVYTESNGKALELEIFVPNGKARHDYFKPTDKGKGLGIIDVISGGWNDSMARRNEHEQAQLFSIFCARGYTIFAIHPGRLPDCTGLEMVANLQQGIRWVKAHAKEYNVDPDRLGLVGASAGGHLSTLAMCRAVAGEADAADPLKRFDTQVKAVGVFFPPTDFLDWDGQVAPINQKREFLLFHDGTEGKPEAAIREQMKALSPALQVTPGLPPLFLFHGDADPIVPLQQSERLLAEMRQAGNQADLIVKKGGGHFWITMPQEIIQLADWFDAELHKE